MNKLPKVNPGERQYNFRSQVTSTNGFQERFSTQSETRKTRWQQTQQPTQTHNNKKILKGAWDSGNIKHRTKSQEIVKNKNEQTQKKLYLLIISEKYPKTKDKNSKWCVCMCVCAHFLTNKTRRAFKYSLETAETRAFLVFSQQLGPVL